MIVKALSVREPWASLFFVEDERAKRCENRSWPTMARYAEPFPFELIIQASQTFSPKQCAKWGVDAETMPRGAAVGIVQVVACMRRSEVAAYARESGRSHLVTPHHIRHIEGPWCWIIENPRRFPAPLPMRGYQGLFDVEINSDFSDAIVQAQPIHG